MITAIRARTVAWRHAEAVICPALIAMPETYLTDLRAQMAEAGVARAVAKYATAPIFDWMIPLIQLQGISDSIAFAYLEKHGQARWSEIDAALQQDPSCHRLSSYWHFSECGFQKSSWSCAEPDHLRECPLPSHPLRKGVLNQAAYSLLFFMRDVCDGDFVGWVDKVMIAADPGVRSPNRGRQMRDALLEPLRNVVGISDKLWSMILAELLLGADHKRERWVSAGATFIAIDTLVHAFLNRTGILRRFNAEHPYGERCYVPGGCSDIIDGIARRIDAREFGDDNPAYFPRFIQHAIWRFCSQGVLNVCNGNRIDDGDRCSNWCCPVFTKCDRISKLK